MQLVKIPETSWIPTEKVYTGRTNGLSGLHLHLFYTSTLQSLQSFIVRSSLIDIVMVIRLSRRDQIIPDYLFPEPFS
jgi:hypothetical protein